MAPQVGLEPEPQIATTETIAPIFSNDTRETEINSDAGFEFGLLTSAEDAENRSNRRSTCKQYIFRLDVGTDHAEDS